MMIVLKRPIKLILWTFCYMSDNFSTKFTKFAESNA